MNTIMFYVKIAVIMIIVKAVFAVMPAYAGDDFKSRVEAYLGHPMLTIAQVKDT